MHARKKPIRSVLRGHLALSSNWEFEGSHGTSRQGSGAPQSGTLATIRRNERSGPVSVELIPRARPKFEGPWNLA